MMPETLRTAHGARGGRVSPPAKSQRDESTPFVAEIVQGFPSEVPRIGLVFGGKLRNVGKRVDALVVAFKVGLLEAVADEIQERQSLADLCGAAELRLGSFRFALRRTRARSVVAFENADVRAVYDPLASGAYVLEIVARATFLATHALSESVALCEAIARTLGSIRDCRLRRFDIAADYAGFALSPNDVERVLTTRARIQAFLTDSKDFDEAAGELAAPVREHRDSVLRVTGITVAAGNPLMARVYAKDVELRHAGREEKREIEHRIWRDNDWDGDEPVTRVEFQCRGEFLDEIRLRNPYALEANLDAVFQRCVRWLRLVEPGTNSRRVRCDPDPRWTVVTSTVFLHEAKPIMRDRKHRGGARPAHVSGAVQSALAAIGQLRPPEFVTPIGEVFEDETLFSLALAPADAEAWVRRRHAEMFAEASVLCSNDALTRHGPQEAVRAVASRGLAVIARFSSADRPDAPNNPAGTPLPPSDCLDGEKNAK
jgi:hypothetical protein